jgi:hypothetical protein
MLLAQVAVLVLGARVGLYVEDRVGVDEQRAMRVTAEVQAAITRQSGATVTVEPSFRCDAEDRCVGEIRTRTRADDVVMLKMFAGPTRIRVRAERMTLGAHAAISAEEELKQDEETWRSPLDGLARTLFPDGPTAPHLVTAQAQVVEGGNHAVWPLLGACTSLALVGAGGVFAARRSSDLSSLGPGAVTRADYWSNHSRAETDTGLAVGLLSAGVVALAVSVIWAFAN